LIPIVRIFLKLISTEKVFDLDPAFVRLRSKQTLDHNPVIRYTDKQASGYSGEKT